MILAYEVNGQPLPPQHGFPLRLVVPGWYGMTNVKWLRAHLPRSPSRSPDTSKPRAIGCCATPTTPGGPSRRWRPAALMIPPGFPDFMSRRRFVKLGVCPIRGRAWSGMAPVTAVQVSDDLGASWHDARLDDADLGPYVWRTWSWTWEPDAAGDYELWCRASDAAGNEQPVDANWNVKGYENNVVQSVPVTVPLEPGDRGAWCRGARGRRRKHARGARPASAPRPRADVRQRDRRRREDAHDGPVDVTERGVHDGSRAPRAPPPPPATMRTTP